MQIKTLNPLACRVVGSSYMCNDKLERRNSPVTKCESEAQLWLAQNGYSFGIRFEWRHLSPKALNLNLALSSLLPIKLHRGHTSISGLCCCSVDLTHNFRFVEGVQRQTCTRSLADNCGLQSDNSSLPFGCSANSN